MAAKPPFHIALDGPAGSGKSTVGKMLARRLNLVFIDTGAMYRALALKAIANKVDVADPAALARLIEGVDIKLDEANRVFLDGRDVTDLIRTPEISRLTSEISTIRPVRQRLVAMQQKIASAKGVVMDGRDIGTVVLPTAQLKIFLTASVAVRAKRRKLELAARNVHMTERQLQEEIIERDRRDTTRDESPLRQAADAIAVDTDNRSAEEIADQIEQLARARM